MIDNFIHVLNLTKKKEKCLPRDDTEVNLCYLWSFWSSSCPLLFQGSKLCLRRYEDDINSIINILKAFERDNGTDKWIDLSHYIVTQWFDNLKNFIHSGVKSASMIKLISIWHSFPGVDGLLIFMSTACHLSWSLSHIVFDKRGVL